MITDGTTHDVKVAPDLISTLDLKETKVVCADKGYDSEPLANQSISKSVGGNSSKIHLIVDAHGNPIDFMITDGTTHDVKVAPDLISTLDLKETKVV
ncbi:hypothetical protein BUV99_13635, partial [Corynebacterium diphtheriae]